MLSKPSEQQDFTNFINSMSNLAQNLNDADYESKCTMFNDVLESYEKDVKHGLWGKFDVKNCVDDECVENLNLQIEKFAHFGDLVVSIGSELCKNNQNNFKLKKKKDVLGFAKEENRNEILFCGEEELNQGRSGIKKFSCDYEEFHPTIRRQFEVCNSTPEMRTVYNYLMKGLL